MATRKDKMKAAAVKMYLNEHPALGKDGPVDWEQIEFAMRFAAAARADAIEECAQIAKAKAQEYASASEEVGDYQHAKTVAANSVAAAILSRKQEEPR